MLSQMEKWNMDKTDFRKCVDGLIESEYIERDPKNSAIIRYAD